MGVIILRVFFCLLALITGWLVAPKDIGFIGPAIGLISAGTVVFLEILLSRVPARKIFLGMLGMLLGLVSARLLIDLILLIPTRVEMDIFIRVLFYYLCAYLGVTVSIRFSGKWFLLSGGAVDDNTRQPLLLDSNVIIDGRLCDLAHTGFLNYNMIVPNFIMKELQTIADAPQDIKRQRGRRGLEILNRLRREPGVVIEISDADFPEIEDIDAKLIQMAKTTRALLLTNDFNLARIAEVQNIKVLNLNNLATVLKPHYLQGDRLMLKIIKPGKETTQGVGYLDDGTMVVVENGRRRVGETVEVQIVNSIQTNTGRMLFAETA